MPTLVGSVSPTDFLLPDAVTHNSSDLVNLKFYVSGSTPSAGVTWTFESSHDAPWWAVGEGFYVATPPGPETNYYVTHDRVGHISGVHRMNVTAPGSVLLADFPLGETITVTVEAATAEELEGLYLHAEAEFATITGPWALSTTTFASGPLVGTSARVTAGQRNKRIGQLQNSGSGYSEYAGRDLTTPSSNYRYGIIAIPSALAGHAVRAIDATMTFGGYLGFPQFDPGQRTAMVRAVTLHGSQGSVMRQDISAVTSLYGSGDGAPIAWGASSDAAAGPEAEPMALHFDIRANLNAAQPTLSFHSDILVPMKAAANATGMAVLITPDSSPAGIDNSAVFGSVRAVSITADSAPATWTTVTFDVPLAPPPGAVAAYGVQTGTPTGPSAAYGVY